jgi:hypothetical protein
MFEVYPILREFPEGQTVPKLFPQAEKITKKGRGIIHGLDRILEYN